MRVKVFIYIIFHGKKFYDKNSSEKFSTAFFVYNSRILGDVSHVFVHASARMHVRVCARACGGQSSTLILR